MYYRVVLAFIVAVLVSTTTFFGNTTAAPIGIEPAENVVVVSPQPTPSAKPTPASPTPQPVKQQPAVQRAAVVGNSLSLPSIGFRAPIVEVGTTASNNIDVPAGMQVGRWVGSALPGQPGAVFLDGHVDGVFAQLHKVTVGQTVRMTYSNQVYAYTVVHTEVVPLNGIDMYRALSVMGTASEGLNIMTCAGSYVASMGTYDHRLVVYAVRA